MRTLLIVFIGLAVIACDKCDEHISEYQKIQKEIADLELQQDDIVTSIDALDPTDEANFSQIEYLFNQFLWLEFEIWSLEERAEELKGRSDCL